MSRTLPLAPNGTGAEGKMIPPWNANLVWLEVKVWACVKTEELS